MTKTCAECRFFAPADSACRRYPPTRVTDQTSALETGGYAFDVITAFPTVGPNDWCGEFQPRHPQDGEVTCG